MKLSYNVVIAMAAGAVMLSLVGCPQKEGPAEHAGKVLDKAMDKAGKKIEKAGESVQDAAKGNGK
jgi:predicted small secreted protein